MSTRDLKADSLSLDQGSLPAQGVPNQIVNDSVSGRLKRWDDTTSSWLDLASGGGGGGTVAWNQTPGEGAILAEEFNQEVYLFDKDADPQSLEVFLRVPETYNAGVAIKLNLAFYSPSTADEWKFQTVTYLVRAGTDAIDSTTNSHTDDTGDVTNGSPANVYRNFQFELSDSAGEVNSVAVSPNDILHIILTREAPGGTEDTEDTRMVPTATEPLFF